MPLTPEQINRRQELTSKLNNRTITEQEAQELKQILEIENREATQSGDMLALIAIGIILLAVLAFLGGGNRRRRRR